MARFQSEKRVSCQVTVGVGVTGIDVSSTISVDRVLSLVDEQWAGAMSRGCGGLPLLIIICFQLVCTHAKHCHFTHDVGGQ